MRGGIVYNKNNEEKWKCGLENNSNENNNNVDRLCKKRGICMYIWILIKSLCMCLGV